MISFPDDLWKEIQKFLFNPLKAVRENQLWVFHHRDDNLFWENVNEETVDLSIFFNSIDIFKYLTLNKRIGYTSRAVKYAIRSSNINLMKRLIRNNDKIIIDDTFVDCAVASCKDENTEIIKYLLDTYSSSLSAINSMYDIFMYANLSVIKLFVENYGCIVDSLSVAIASHYCDIKTFKYVYDKVERHSDSYSLIQHSSQNKSLEIAKFLLAEGIQPTPQDFRAFIVQKNLRIIKFYIKRGFRNFGEPLLNDAIGSKKINYKIVKTILKADKNIVITTYNIESSVLHKNFSILKILLKKLQQYTYRTKITALKNKYHKIFNYLDKHNKWMVDYTTTNDIC